ncbi:type II secretion system F family protein [Nonomuraea sp. NPDC002799]
MLPLLFALCAATAAAWLWFSPRTPATRLSRLLPAAAKTLVFAGRSTSHRRTQVWNEEPHQPTWLNPTQKRPKPIATRTVIAATVSGLITALLIGGTPGMITGLLVAPAVATVLHRQTPEQELHDRQRIVADLPFAADLMTACLLAGRPVSAATEIAAKAVAGPLGQRLTWASSQLRLGADPAPTWACLARDPEMAALARAMSRAAQSGAPVADVLTRLADDAREKARAVSVATARNVGVKAVAPLGLCFLPAFVLLGIVPVIAGLAATIIIP